MRQPLSILLISGFSLLGLGCEASRSGGPTSPSSADSSVSLKDTTKAPTDTTKSPKDTSSIPSVPLVPVPPPKDSIVRPAEGSVNGLPTVTTTALSMITRSTVVTGGTIVSEGSSPILHKGIVRSEYPQPIVKSPRMYDDETDFGEGNGAFSLETQGLKPGTTYYIRAFATNSAGTAYGAEHMFTTTALTTNPGTCSPEINTVDFNHEHNQFYAVVSSTRENTYGDFTLSASASRVDVDMQFLRRPKPGLYTIFEWDGWDIKPTEVYVSGVFGSQFYVASQGDTVRVDTLPDGKLSVTFCSLHFASGGTNFDFVTGGNLTEH